jgi:hypothetical protein
MENRPDLDKLFASLAKSRFRSTFKLKQNDIEYISEKGMPVIKSHSLDFITKRLAPAFPTKDGKQTPTKGHPVFIAQHATATCCRKCLNKWHRIPTGRQLNNQQIDYIISIISAWLNSQLAAE